MRTIVPTWIWLILLVSPATAAPVNLCVDLGPYQAAGYFEPATDGVEVRGDFSGWAGGLHELAPFSGTTHAVTLDLPPGAIAYKFVIVRGGGAVVWEEHIDNRMAVVPAAGLDLPAVFFDGLTAAPDPGAAVIGSDLSFVPQLQSLGAVYGQAGTPAPLLSLMNEAGHTLVRLRLWHTPAEPWQGLAATVDFARDLAAAGFDLMLDLHYSDTWADPAHQTKPAAWLGLSTAALVDSVAAYTSAVISRFAVEQIPLAYVQIGNEIDGGLLWDDGRVGWPDSQWDTPGQWSACTSLLQAAAAAVRAASPTDRPPGIIVHAAEGGSLDRCRWFFDGLAAAGVDYDIIGLSYYPWWHGTLWDLETNLLALQSRFARQVMVVETAYPWTLEAFDATGNFVTSTDELHAGYPATPLGQRDFLRDVRRVVETAGGRGVVYWEPAFVPVTGGPGNPYENLTLFDFEGMVLPALSFGLPTAAAGAAGPPPSSGSLQPNRPNPFNPATEIPYTLARDGRVRLQVFDLEGQLVCTLLDSVQQAGPHRTRWRAINDRGRPVASGTYLCVLKTGDGTETRKMVLVR